MGKLSFYESQRSEKGQSLASSNQSNQWDAIDENIKKLKEHYWTEETIEEKEG